jgi:hypothetical protein
MHARPLRAPNELLEGRAVLTSTVIGIEHPRPLPPLFHMVGPLSEGDAAAGDSLPTEVLAWLQDAKVSRSRLGVVLFGCCQGMLTRTFRPLLCTGACR